MEKEAVAHLRTLASVNAIMENKSQTAFYYKGV